MGLTTETLRDRRALHVKRPGAGRRAAGGGERAFNLGFACHLRLPVHIGSTADDFETSGVYISI